MSDLYEVIFSKLAQEKFDDLIGHDRRIGKQIAGAIDRLARNPALGEPLKGKWQGYQKYRTGDYRIVYRVEQTNLIIYIVTLGNRKNVYD